MKVRSFYLLVAVIAIIILFTYFQEWNIKNKTAKSGFEPSYKELNEEKDLVEHLDSTTLIYSNFKYGFSMNFPDEWNIDRGVSEHTIIRGVQNDSALSFVINVIELKDMKSENLNIWELWDNKNMDLEYRKILPKLVKSDIYNYNSRKVYVSNTEAIEIKYNYIAKDVDVECEMQSHFYSIYQLPFTYTVGLHAPKIFYEKNPVRYDHLIKNFVLMQPK